MAGFLAVAVAIAWLLAPAASRAPLVPDGSGRFETPMMVNGEGPFRFLVDTAAQMTCLSRALAERLHPWELPVMHAQLVGASGTDDAALVLLRRLRGAAVQHWFEPAVVLPSSAATQADGVLAASSFSGQRLELDFARRTLSRTPSAPTPAGFTAVAGELRRGMKMILPVRIDGIAARALLDTGARRTHGNPALLHALGYADDDPRLRSAAPLQGATSEEIATRAAVIHDLEIGPLRFGEWSFAFSRNVALEAAGLGEEPALVLGMDVLGTLRALAVDYGRNEVQLAR